MSKILELIRAHEKYRALGINLVASENVLSQTVLRVLSSDLNGRYAAELYGGTKYIREIIEETKSLLAELFKAEYASPKPVSGTISVVATLLSFTKRGDKVAILHFKDGGFPLNIQAYDRVPIYFPYDNVNLNIDVDKAIELLSNEKPSLVFLGASRFLFPHPVREISELVHEYGGKVCYDGSHVLGLIAGGTFQDPLSEGADMLIGSTHKTFPGPQGGVFLTNEKRFLQEFESFLNRPYTLVDNPHVARIAALGVAAEEMIKFGRDYAKMVISNSKSLAEELNRKGVNVLGREKGYTQSHQIILSVKEKSEDVKNKLENVKIFIDAIGRIGTQEVTRRGMKKSEMRKIAELISKTIRDQDVESVKREVSKLASKFNSVKYSFDEA